VADPETYYWHLEQLIGKVAPGKETGKVAPMPIVFRDEASNAYYNGLIDTETGQVARIAKAGRDGLPDWMVQYGSVMPENVPIWNFEFNPQREQSVSFSDRFINKYVPSEYMRYDADMPISYLESLDYGSATELSRYCPTIAELILHVIGGDVAMFNHFLNWLAAAIQLKDKLGTAWILQGTQGTGKGVLFDKVLTPLIGHGTGDSQPYTAKVRLENIEDQFNQWMECALFVAFDEFRLEDSLQSKKLFNKIKSMITETIEPIRGMRENLRNVRTYTNYLFFSNDKDVMYLPTDDRRFNVAPRQEVKVDTVLGDMEYATRVLIPGELPIFAQVLKDFNVDYAQARTVIENEAKQQMRAVSRTTIEDFVSAFLAGDLDYFLPILDMPYSVGQNYLLPAQTIIRAIIRDTATATEHRITVEELRYLYNIMVGRSDNVRKFGKLLHRHGLGSQKLRIAGRVVWGYAVHWGLSDNDVENLKGIYLNDVDLHFGDNPKVTPILRAYD
jgi:hypothetical protein